MRQIGHAVKEDMMKASYENYLKRVRDFPVRRDEQIKKRNPLYFQGYMENSIRVAKWCVARCFRSLGKVEEALREQRDLLEEHQSIGSKAGFVNEEIGECLTILGKAVEARPHFAAAYAVLSKDPWLAESEPKRIQRLKELGEAQ